jgi:phage-related holin
MDVLTGVTEAIKSKTLNSTKMREGFFHKLAYALGMAFGWLWDFSQAYIDIGVNIPIAGLICGYIVLMEVCSIIENIGKLNPHVLPKQVRELFEKLADEQQNGDEQNG